MIQYPGREMPPNIDDVSTLVKGHLEWLRDSQAVRDRKKLLQRTKSQGVNVPKVKKLARGKFGPTELEESNQTQKEDTYIDNENSAILVTDDKAVKVTSKPKPKTK